MNYELKELQLLIEEKNRIAFKIFLWLDRHGLA